MLIQLGVPSCSTVDRGIIDCGCPPLPVASHDLSLGQYAGNAGQQWASNARKALHR